MRWRRATGLAKVFRSLGTHCIISGGQTMNPSTQDLLEAIRRLPVDDVLILPNNGNILMAASQAQALAAGEGKNVAVVPCKSDPAGDQRAAGAQPARRPDAQRRGHGERGPSTCKPAR